MPSISKFLFDTSFDGPAAKAPPKPVRRNFTAAEVEAEKAKAFADGHAAGINDTANEAAQRTAASLEAISARLGEILRQADKSRETSLRTAVAAATAMTRKLLPALARREAINEIEELVRDCLGRMHDEPKIVLRLHESLVETFRARIDATAEAAGFSGRVVVVADPKQSPADARVEWADGGVERNTQQVWQEIEAIIERFVASGPTK